MSTRLIQFEKMTREIIEKQEVLLQGICENCLTCGAHRQLLLRANFQTITLMRGLVVYLERLKNDRREKRRRHKENLNMRKKTTNFN